MASEVQDFKAFADVNKELIIKMRHSRFYCTLLLKDLLNDFKLDELMRFYGLTGGDIQAFQQRCVSINPLSFTNSNRAHFVP